MCSKSDLEGVDLDAGRIGSVGRPSDKEPDVEAMYVGERSL